MGRNPSRNKEIPHEKLIIIKAGIDNRDSVKKICKDARVGRAAVAWVRMFNSY